MTHQSINGMVQSSQKLTEPRRPCLNRVELDETFCSMWTPKIISQKTDEFGAQITV